MTTRPCWPPWPCIFHAIYNVHCLRMCVRKGGTKKKKMRKNAKKNETKLSLAHFLCRKSSYGGKITTYWLKLSFRLASFRLFLFLYSSSCGLHIWPSAKYHRMTCVTLMHPHTRLEINLPKHIINHMPRSGFVRVSKGNNKTERPAWIVYCLISVKLI